jgi:hypothetical protein
MVKRKTPLRGMHPSRISAQPQIARKKEREKDNAETLRAPRFRRENWEKGDDSQAR